MVLDRLTDAYCRDEERRAIVLAHPRLNGIDFVEYFEDLTSTPPRHWLVVSFVKPAPDPTSFYGLVGHPEHFRVEGGVRIVGVEVTAVAAGPLANQLVVDVDRSGDFSTYQLIVSNPDPSNPALDPQLSSAPFGFKAGCPTDFDCRRELECLPEEVREPVLDYLAKDYASFRRLMLDLIPQLNSGWIERNPADLGMVLVELLAHAGDHLSYFQDAVATEAYLDTARHRVSVKRHARLIDYCMHDGRNAWTFIQFDVTNVGVIPAGTMLLTRIAEPLRDQTTPPGITVQPEDLNFNADPALRNVVSFETTARFTVNPINNTLWFHTWGNRDCCLPRGTTGAYLYALEPGTGPTRRAVRPALNPGDYIVLEEVKGPNTGLTADADPAHRQVVRLLTVEPDIDLVYRDELTYHADLDDYVLEPITDPDHQDPLPVTRVTWRSEDELTFPLCLSVEQPETGPLMNVSIARGNVIPCDHGRTIVEALPLPTSGGGRRGLLQLQLPGGPLTFQPMPAEPIFDDQGRLFQGRFDLDVPARQVAPAIVLMLGFPAAETEIWRPVPDLLDSHSFDRHFVVDVDNNGQATLRFGDDEYGRRPIGVESVSARFRIGNGLAGNIGAESLVHVVQPTPADMVDPADPSAPFPVFPAIQRVWQPIAAAGGVDPETIEEVRQFAPRAFHAEQFRAVTEADYQAAAMKVQGVGAAKCSFRWTGSWHTVFVGVHPSKSSDLVTESGGRTRLSAELVQAVEAQLTRYKLAGYDLEIQTAQYVPLEIALQICVGRGHFRGDVLKAVTRALSNRQFPDGTIGFFHPSQFAFGQSVYLSQIYATVNRIEGVESVVVTTFKRYWNLPGQELEEGVIEMGAWEIARLDNDPNFRENGVLELTAHGGL